MMEMIKETKFHRVWKAVGVDVFGFKGEFFKYLVIDLRNGGSTALRTNSVLEAMSWEPYFTPDEIMSRTLLELIKEFSQKNTGFNRKMPMETYRISWNKTAMKYGRPEFLIPESFSRRQQLANKFAEIYEAL